MENYENKIMELLSGETPKQKYENLESLNKLQTLQKSYLTDKEFLYDSATKFLLLKYGLNCPFVTNEETLKDYSLSLLMSEFTKEILSTIT